MILWLLAQVLAVTTPSQSFTNSANWMFDGDIPRGYILNTNEPPGPSNTPAARQKFRMIGGSDFDIIYQEWDQQQQRWFDVASIVYLNGQAQGRAQSRTPRQLSLWSSALLFDGVRTTVGPLNRADGHLMLKNRTALDFETSGPNVWAKPGFYTEATTNGYRLVIASDIPSAPHPWEIGVATSNAVPWACFWRGEKNGLEVFGDLIVNGWKLTINNIGQVSAVRMVTNRTARAALLSPKMR